MMPGVSRKKRAVVVSSPADQLMLGERHSERHGNDLLQRHHPDRARWRGTWSARA